MATNVTSSVRSGPKSVNFWVQMCGCRFAMLSIANPAARLDVIHRTSHSKPDRQPNRQPRCTRRA
jgi:hypothetical protein